MAKCENTKGGLSEIMEEGEISEEENLGKSSDIGSGLPLVMPIVDEHEDLQSSGKNIVNDDLEQETIDLTVPYSKPKLQKSVEDGKSRKVKPAKHCSRHGRLSRTVSVEKGTIGSQSFKATKENISDIHNEFSDLSRKYERKIRRGSTQEKENSEKRRRSKSTDTQKSDHRKHSHRYLTKDSVDEIDTVGSKKSLKKDRAHKHKGGKDRVRTVAESDSDGHRRHHHSRSSRMFTEHGRLSRHTRHSELGKKLISHTLQQNGQFSSSFDPERFKDNALMRRLLESGTLQKKKSPVSEKSSDLNCEIGSLSSISSLEFSLLEEGQIQTDFSDDNKSEKETDERKQTDLDSDVEIIIPQKVQPEIIDLKSESDSEIEHTTDPTDNKIKESPESELVTGPTRDINEESPANELVTDPAGDINKELPENAHVIDPTSDVIKELSANELVTDTFSDVIKELPPNEIVTAPSSEVVRESPAKEIISDPVTDTINELPANELFIDPVSEVSKEPANEIVTPNDVIKESLTNELSTDTTRDVIEELVAYEPIADPVSSTMTESPQKDISQSQEVSERTPDTEVEIATNQSFILQLVAEEPVNDKTEDEVPEIGGEKIEEQASSDLGKNIEDDEANDLQLRLAALRSAILKKHVARMKKRQQKTLQNNKENSEICSSLELDQLESTGGIVAQTSDKSGLNVSSQESIYCPSNRTSPISPTSSYNFSLRDDNEGLQDMELVASDEEETIQSPEKRRLTEGDMHCFTNNMEKENFMYQPYYMPNFCVPSYVPAGFPIEYDYSKVMPQPLPPGVDISSVPPEFSHSVFVCPSSTVAENDGSNKHFKQMDLQFTNCSESAQLCQTPFSAISSDLCTDPKIGLENSATNEGTYEGLHGNYFASPLPGHNDISHNVYNDELQTSTMDNEMNSASCYHTTLEENVPNSDIKMPAEHSSINTKRKRTSNKYFRQITIEGIPNQNLPEEIVHEHNKKAKLDDCEHVSQAFNKNITSVEYSENMIACEVDRGNQSTLCIENELISSTTDFIPQHDEINIGQGQLANTGDFPPVMGNIQEDDSEEFLRAKLLSALINKQKKESPVEVVKSDSVNGNRPISPIINTSTTSVNKAGQIISKYLKEVVAKRKVHVNKNVKRKNLPADTYRKPKPLTPRGNETFMKESLQVTCGENNRKTVLRKRPIADKLKTSQSLPITQPQQKFIIHVGQDSEDSAIEDDDSNEWSRRVLMNNTAAHESVEPLLQKNKTHPPSKISIDDVKRLEKQIEFMLQEVRKQHEVPILPTTRSASKDNDNKNYKQNIKLLSQKTKTQNKFVSKSVESGGKHSPELAKNMSKCVKENSTPAAVKHLPKSQQEEYRRLKQAIAEKERLRKFQLAQKISSLNSPNGNASPQSIPQSEAVYSGDDLSQPPVEEPNNDTCDNNSNSAQFNTNNNNQLIVMETKLVNQRFEVLDRFSDMCFLLGSIELKTETCSKTEKEILRLRKLLEVTEKDLEEEKQQLNNMFNDLTVIEEKIGEGRSLCSQHAKVCMEVGGRVIGEVYKLPAGGDDLLRRKSSEVLKRKDLIFNRRRTVVVSEGGNVKITVNGEKNKTDVNGENTAVHTEETSHSLSNSDKRAEEVKQPVTKNQETGNRKSISYSLPDYVSPLYHLHTGGSRNVSVGGESYHQAILCPYDLMGNCKDDACPYKH